MPIHMQTLPPNVACDLQLISATIHNNFMPSTGFFITHPSFLKEYLAFDFCFILKIQSIPSFFCSSSVSPGQKFWVVSSPLCIGLDCCGQCHAPDHIVGYWMMRVFGKVELWNWIPRSPWLQPSSSCAYYWVLLPCRKQTWSPDGWSFMLPFGEILPMQKKVTWWDGGQRDGHGQDTWHSSASHSSLFQSIYILAR